MSPQPLRRFWSLDALRGACALVVFLSHWMLWSDFAPRSALERGGSAVLHWIHDAFTTLAWPTGGNHPAVIGFFVLSGFCIHYRYARDAAAGRPQSEWSPFYRRRFLRIMPIYWTATLLGMVFVAAELRHPVGDALLSLHAEKGVREFLIRLAGANTVYPHEILAGNQPLNTVAAEIILYVAYPLFYAQVARGRWFAVGLAFLGLEGMGLVLLPRSDPFWVYNSVLMYGIFWYAGALTAHHFVRKGTQSRLGALLLAWIVFVILNSLPHFYGLSVIKQNAWGVVCVLVVLQCLHREQRRAKGALGFGTRAMVFAGDVSYSMYAVHAPVFFLTTWALIRADVSQYWIQLPVTLAAGLAATLAAHFLIERVFYQPKSGSQQRQPKAQAEAQVAAGS